MANQWLYGPEGWDAPFRNEFIQWGQQDNRVLGYPKLSQELFERAAPTYLYRAVVGGVTDFTRGNADYILFNKLQNAYTEVWKSNVGEFEDFPHFRMGWARSSIKVDERGIAIKLTERERLFARENVESIVRNYLSQVVARSIEVNILDNAILWTDIVFVKTDEGVEKIRGKAIGDRQTRADATATSKTFFQEAGAPYSFSVPLLFQSDYDSPTRPLEVQDLLEVQAEFIRRRMKARTNYVIMNITAFNQLFRDPFFQNVIAYSRPERLENGELGTLFGFTFLVDNSGELENVLEVLNANLKLSGGTKQPADDDKKINSIVIFVGQDGYREAVALPETVATDIPVSVGRFTRLVARTYRGEQPMWFYADPQLAIDPTTGGSLPEDRRVSSGIILLGG